MGLSCSSSIASDEFSSFIRLQLSAPQITLPSPDSVKSQTNTFSLFVFEPNRISTMSAPANNRYEPHRCPSLITTAIFHHYTVTNTAELTESHLELKLCLSQMNTWRRCLLRQMWITMPDKTSILREEPLAWLLSQEIRHNICRHGISDGKTQNLILGIKEKANIP